MKKFIFLFGIISIISCSELDLNPLSSGSSENWYSNQIEFNLALNDLYRDYPWAIEVSYRTERYSDNWNQRLSLYSYPGGTISSDWSDAGSNWVNFYKGISRANSIVYNLQEENNVVAEEFRNRYEAEARFMRATFYGTLIFLYGDVPYFTEYLDIDQAFNIGRTDKDEILNNIYEDFDFAAEHLPEKYGSGELKRATKGAAYAMKARIALYFSDWEVVKNAAEDCINLGVYSLHPDFGEYFLSSTKNSDETIFAIPRSQQLNSFWSPKSWMPRTVGGTSTAQPSWELFYSFLCTDGLPVDESPLFDPKEPFKNRDPRLAETIVPFGSVHLGVVYDPHPNSKTVLNVSTGKMVRNRDTRSVDIYASYNGLTLNKGVSDVWLTQKVDNDIILMRYADVLLMKAEADIELNEIDESTLKAINQVRARAYGVNESEVSEYPSVQVSSQSELRTILRTERRVELAWENRRLADLIRWRLAEVALRRPVYGLLDSSDLLEKIVDEGLWFLPEAPEVDENGLVDFSSLYNKGLISKHVERNFNPERQYLWPIPFKETQINPNIKQNPGY
ncbi:RagB/SusD family nutrient uptake outer membrane protein [Wenyingzhuangia sp. 2_MG-2023]|uniref:RagB/SusD family nutrient uptake outer membrane protein n=1 Tax=Wenyingzhuangia sp. 2_MG-2023 TaxID=3062639 RepID=UPI0026E48834|nr:RagB/SusD family nutrient uptake outer membrane protein [Wenyingzhuangia sp. 2_MG-2023]MDO6738207.1 RagB/SusD family nutrient uptake outer membrane protein [Wenyingzhuangia sp. 2_MG-2023]